MIAVVTPPPSMFAQARHHHVIDADEFAVIMDDAPRAVVI